MKTDKELIEMNPSTACAADLLLLMKLAYTDLEKATKGNLYTLEGFLVIPKMSVFSVLDKSKAQCYACLAGCLMTSRVGSVRSLTAVDDFLDSCRYIPKGYCIAGEILNRVGVITPTLNDLPLYSNADTVEVLLMLEWIFAHNSHLMPIAQPVTQPQRVSVGVSD